MDQKATNIAWAQKVAKDERHAKYLQPPDVPSPSTVQLIAQTKQNPRATHTRLGLR